MLHDYRHSRAVILCTSVRPAEEAARRSAERLASLLTGAMCGWPQDRLMVLDNESQPGDLANTLTETFDDVKDVAFFYYIGPAKVVDGQFFITLTQPPGGEPESGSLPLEALTRALANSKAATKVVILDWHFGFVEVLPDDLISALAPSNAYIIGALIEAGRAWFDPDANEFYLSKYLCDIIEDGVNGLPPPRLSIELVYSELTRLTDQRPLDLAHRPVPGAARFELAHNVRRSPQWRDAFKGWLIGVPTRLAAFRATMYAQRTMMRAWGARRVDRARGFVFARNAVEESTKREPGPQIEERKKWTRSQISLLVVAACIVFALVAVALKSLLPRSPQPVLPTTTSYSFPARQYSDGLVVTRYWMLSGPDGSELTEQLTVSNISGTVLHLPFKEPIPAAIVSLRNVQSSPQVPKIIDANHVFEWDISLAGGGHEVITYKAKVPPRGIAYSRIDLMAQRFDIAAAKLPSPGGRKVREVHLRSLMMTVAKIRVTAGKSVRLALTGTMSNDMNASAAVLAMVKWIVEYPEIAKVNAFGKLTGLAPGRTHVTARFGRLSASALIIVKPGANIGTGSAPGNSNGGQTHPGPSSDTPPRSSHPPTSHPPPSSSSPPTITPSHTLT